MSAANTALVNRGNNVAQQFVLNSRCRIQLPHQIRDFAVITHIPYDALTANAEFTILAIIKLIPTPTNQPLPAVEFTFYQPLATDQLLSIRSTFTIQIPHLNLRRFSFIVKFPHSLIVANMEIIALATIRLIPQPMPQNPSPLPLVQFTHQQPLQQIQFQNGAPFPLYIAIPDRWVACSFSLCDAIMNDDPEDTETAFTNACNYLTSSMIQLNYENLADNLEVLLKYRDFLTERQKQRLDALQSFINEHLGIEYRDKSQG